MLEAITFWLGKFFAEFIFFIGIAILFALVMFILVIWEKYS